MTIRPLQILFSAAAAFACAAALATADQVRRQGPARPTVPMEVSLKLAGEAYEAKTEGTCTHAPKASIYGVLSEMWTVRHTNDGRSVQLTLWKPADGSPSMFSLSANGKKSWTISTVRGGEVTGTGTVTLAPAAKGGTFTIDAKGTSGEAASGTIKCEAFTPAIAEGGD